MTRHASQEFDLAKMGHQCVLDVRDVNVATVCATLIGSDNGGFDFGRIDIEGSVDGADWPDTLASMSDEGAVDLDIYDYAYVRAVVGTKAAGRVIVRVDMTARAGEQRERTHGTSFPSGALYTGRRFYRTDLCEWFTYLSAADSPTGAAIWLGEVFQSAFGTAQNTSTSGTYNFFASDVLTNSVDRGPAFSFDCLVTSIEANNGDNNTVTGILTFYKNSTMLTSQMWSSETQKGTTPLVKLSAGEVFGCAFSLTSGTLTRMAVRVKLARMESA